MRRTEEKQGRWRASGQRIVAYVAVTGLHVAFVMFLLLEPSTPGHVPALHSMSARDAIRVRLLRYDPVASMPPVARSLPPPRRRKSARQTSTLHALPLKSAARAPSTPDEATVPTDGPPTYIDGGGRFREPSLYLRSNNTQLPGSGVPIVKGLRMIDPRMRGVGGAVRNLQAIFGAPDPHCVDVDAWRGMPVQELLDRHMSPSRVESTAQEYGCGPPR